MFITRCIRDGTFESLPVVAMEPLVQDFRMPWRLGKRLAEIDLLKGSAQNAANEDLAQRFSGSNTANNESAAGPSVDYELSAMTWLSISRSGGVSAFLDDSEGPPVCKTRPEKHPQAVQARFTTGGSMLDFSRRLSGSISSFDMRSGATSFETFLGKPRAEENTLPTEWDRSELLEQRSSRFKIRGERWSTAPVNVPQFSVQSIVRNSQNRLEAAFRLRVQLKRKEERRLALDNATSYMQADFREASDGCQQVRGEVSSASFLGVNAAVVPMLGTSVPHKAGTSAEHTTSTSAFYDISSYESLSCDTGSSAARSSSPVKQSRRRAFLDKLSSCLPGICDSASCTFSRSNSGTGVKAQEKAASTKRDSLPNLSPSANSRQEEGGETLISLRSLGKRIAGGFISRLRRLSQRRRGAS